MKFTLIMPLILALLTAPALRAAETHERILVDKSTAGSVSFVAVGRPSMLKIKGKAGAPKGAININGNKASGEITFKLDDLDTGMNMRNEHMKKKYLETDKYPDAKLTFKDVELPPAFAKDTVIEKLPFKGMLTVHGKEAPVDGTAKVTRKGQSVDVDADVETKTTAHGIATPSFAGITVGENISINVQFTAPVEALR